MTDDLRLEVRAPSAVKNLGEFVAMLTIANAPDEFPGPRVVAVNRFGMEHIIQQYRSKRAASKALPDFQAQLDEMGPAAWRELHNVPPHFELMQHPD